MTGEGGVAYERVPAVGVKFHEYAELFPWLEGAAFDELKADISRNGVIEPIVFIGDTILDGRNRYMAARDLGIEYPRVEYSGNNPLDFVVSKNLARRHLSESQRARVAGKIANMPQGARTDLEPSANMQKVSVAAAAQLLNVSERAVHQARTVERDAIPEVAAAVDAGQLAVSTAAEIATLPRPEQRLIDLFDKKAVLDAAKEIRAERAHEKRAARTVLLTELSNRNAPLPDRKYPVIYADPPWEYDFSPSNDRSVENHYPTMPIEDILALEVESLATPDAMLFLWAPPSFIKKGIQVLEAWGFELASSMVWDKEKIGTGIYFRQQHEYLLLGKRGHPITPVPGTQPRSVLRVPRGEHSAKPDEAYQIIERMYPGLPKIELFARSARGGFDSWGNQAEAA